MNNEIKKITAIGVFFAGLFFGLPASAQDTYPSKPIRLVLGFAAGGGTDVIARTLAQKMGEILGQTVILENKPGANGNIAADMVVKSDADGYTLLYNTSSIVLSPSLYSSLNYDVLKDFSPVSLTANIPIILVVSPKLGMTNVQAFVSALKARPGQINYASAGNGNITHLSALLFLQAVGASATHIPYKSESPAVTDVMGGQVDFYLGTAAGVIPMVRDNRLNGLAVSTLARMEAVPGIPTMSESVAPGLELGAWSGIIAPAGTKPEIIDKLNATIKLAMQDKVLLQKFEAQGAQPKYSTPSQYEAFIKSELVRWTEIIKLNKVRMD